MVEIKMYFSVPQVTDEAVKFKFSTISLSADHQLYRWLPKARLSNSADKIKAGDYGVIKVNLHNNQYNDYNLDFWVNDVSIRGNKPEYVEERAKYGTRSSKSTSKSTKDDDFDDDIPF